MSLNRTFNLADLFEIVAAVVPQRVAFKCGAQQLTFSQLDERATRLASALRDRGVQRGDNVGIQLYNSAEYLESFFACCKIGAAPVNVNYRYVGEELAYLFNTLELKALVYGAAFDEEVVRTVPRIPTLRLLLRVGQGSAPAGPVTPADYESLLAGGAATLADPDRSDNDIYMLCTGGTTGMPKGVMWPHKSILMAALGGGGIYFGRPPIKTPSELAEFVPHGPALTYFATAPMMHGAAMWATLISLLAGHTVVVNDQPSFDAEHVWDITVREGVNILSVVGDAMALPLIRALEANPTRWSLQHLRTFGNGGAVFSKHLQERLKALLPHISISNAMGSSEAGLVGGKERPPGSDGMLQMEPRPDLAVIDDELRIVTAPGCEGTLARTGYTPVGYYGDAKKSAETFVMLGGRLWVLTGDRARIDADGHYVILGRGSQCINSGGEKIYPEEVEEAARRYGAVGDVLVVGIPDERWGQKVAAIVQVTAGASFDRAEFERVCRAHLSGYKVPKVVCLVDQVQRSPAGKADYTWAKKLAATQAGA